MRKILFYICLSIIMLQGCGIKTQEPYANIRNIQSTIGENVVCFGDSLTAGEGAEKGKDYPSLLATRLGIKVVNAGKSGDTTETALNRVDKVLAQDPKIVIVEFGANDFLTSFQGGWKEADTSDVKAFENLKIIVNKIQNSGAVVIIAGIQINSKYEKGYKKLASETGSILMLNILEGIYGNQKYMSPDNRHPNALGYQKIADMFVRVIEPLLEEMEK